MDAVCKLISKTQTTDSLGYPIATESAREVFCSVESITRAEFFNAGKAGFTPEYSFKVSAVDYSGEDLLEYETKRYSIYRTYRSGDYMELYAEYRSGVTDYVEPVTQEVSEDVIGND